MKALRIVLTQKSANYRKEEALTNKMTYPLPPVSTVIGALHDACGFSEYKDMKLSIQGSYGSLSKRAYTDYCYLNSVMDDRGSLLKVENGEILSKAFIKIASSKKSQGNSFKNETTIQVHNRKILDDYHALDIAYDEVQKMKQLSQNELNDIKNQRKIISEQKKSVDKKSDGYAELINQEKLLKEKELKIKEEFKNFENENYNIPKSKFKLLTTSLKFYEILHNVKLILHVAVDDEEILSTIYDNVYNIKSIGRSEDFIDILDYRIVELKNSEDCEIESPYSAYLAYDDVINKRIYTRSAQNKPITGTKYYLNKRYNIVDNQRIFEKKKVVYASRYAIERTSDNIWIDDDGEEKYIVNFL